MGELFRDNSRLVALMSGLFTGIIVVMGAVALFLGELDYPPLFADASSAGMAGQEPGGGESRRTRGRRSSRSIPIISRTR